jgi:ectoine hydroxylase-related dioxygenase (phytanoyl-CoA dioxygenase family)
MPNRRRYLFQDGFQITDRLLDPAALEEIINELNYLERGTVGTRDMLQSTWCHALAAELQNHSQIAPLLDEDAVPIQCTYFEKSSAQNWLVPIHQDLSIPVKARFEHPQLSGWSIKDGQVFVQPPVEVLERLLALRLHIDDCGENDGALRVVPGSHLHARLNTTATQQLKSISGEVACAVPAGAALLMRPLLLHASSKSTGTSRRRVLHFLFAPKTLPFGLEWAVADASPN